MLWAGVSSGQNWACNRSKWLERYCLVGGELLLLGLRVGGVTADLVFESVLGVHLLTNLIFKSMLILIINSGKTFICHQSIPVYT